MRNKQGIFAKVPSKDLSSEKRINGRVIARRSQLQFRFQKDRFPPREVVFINLAYRAGESPLLPSEYQGSCRDFAGTKPDGGSIYSAENGFRRGYYTRDAPRTRREYCSSILPPLICQITLALEKGMLVSDLGVNGRSRAHGVRVSRKTTRLN